MDTGMDPREGRRLRHAVEKDVVGCSLLGCLGIELKSMALRFKAHRSRALFPDALHTCAASLRLLR
jgi:hypothetical protein